MNGTKANPRRPGRRKLFFRDLVAPALQAKRLRGNSEASLAKDEQRLGRLLLIGSVPAREITPGIIERALEALARGDHACGPLKGSTVNRYHSAVGSVLRYAGRHGFIGSNPLADGGVPWSKEKVHVRFLSAGEEARLLKVIRADCPDKEPEFMLAVLTGMRRSEQFSVRWEDWSSPSRHPPRRRQDRCPRSPSEPGGAGAPRGHAKTRAGWAGLYHAGSK